MKKLLPLIVLLFCSSAHASFTHFPVVQSHVQQNGNTCVFPRNVTAGNLIIASQTWWNSTGAITISDSVSTSYTQDALQNTGGGTNPAVVVYSGIAGGSGANTVTLAVSGATFKQTTCVELKPLWTLTVDAAATNTVSSTPATPTTSTITTTLNDDLIYTTIGGDSSAAYFNVHSPDVQVGFANFNDSTAAAVKLAGAAGMYSTTYDNGNNAVVTLAIVAYKSISGITIQSPTTLPDGSLTNAYDYTLQATGGVGSYTWSITSGSLQPGLSLNTSTGQISGTPTSGPQNSITFHVTDGSNTADLMATLKVSSTPNTAAFVQGTHHLIGSGIAFISNVTAGDVLLATRGPNIQTVGYCTDSLGTIFENTTLAATYAQVTAAGDIESQTWVSIGTATMSGADTITCDSDSNIRNIAEFSGVSYFGNDNVLNTPGSSTSSPITSSSLTTLVPGEMLFCTNAQDIIGETFVIQAPFTSISASNTEGYRAVTTVGAYNCSYTISGSMSRWAIMLMGLRPSGGTVAPPPPSGVLHATQEY